MNLETILIALISMVGGSAGAAFFARRKTNSEAILNNSKADISTAEFIKEWANELKSDNDKMREELRSIRNQLADSNIENRELKAKIKELERLLTKRDQQINQLKQKYEKE